MKKIFKYTNLLLLTLLLINYSCSNDDETITSVISLQDLEVTIGENPTSGQVIGTVQSDSNTSLTFSITAQTPTGVLSIDSNTGQLTVADATLFDFETNPVITATVAADEAQNTASVIINLNNINELAIQGLTASIDENPINGDTIGTVQATGDGVLSFSIASQTPAGAISIDSNSGELTVMDATLFDYETNPIISATISVSNSEGNENSIATINLNDIDNIKELLSTSQADYNAASSGDWVIITETEYNNIANNLAAITRSATTETEYGSTISSVINSNNNSITVANSTTNLVPANSYLIAFKYKIWNSANVTGVKLKLSSSANNSGFMDFGNPLPTHSGNNEDVFFVLKNNNTSINAESYLGFFQSNSSIFLYDDATTSGAYWGIPDTSNLNASPYTNRNVFYQGLSTTQVQW